MIQTQVCLSLGITEHARRSATDSTGTPEPIGTHRQANSHLRRGQRLTGDDWHANTAGFRQLMDRVFTRRANRDQATSLFAVTRWQRPHR